MKHPHYDKIVAKAANMDLVVFSKGSGGWIELQCAPSWGDKEYFLCHPKHKEACLHWLNGGECQIFIDGEWGSRATPKSEIFKWDSDLIWNSDKLNIRIKPRKEKRWIGIHESALSHLPKTKEEAENHYKNHSGMKIIEIEVEV